MTDSDRNAAAGNSTHTNPDPMRWPAIGVMCMVVLTLPTILLIVKLSEQAPPQSTHQLAAEQFGLDVETYATGRSIFATACVLCHGDRGQGVPNLGRPLRNSEFVQTSNDEQLVALITNGRLPDDPNNSSGVLMPARGANPAVTDAKIPAVIAFLRTMQEEGAPFTDASAWVVSQEERDAARAALEASAPAGVELSGAGYDAFVASCSACHGARGEGMEGLGKPFVGSAFIQSKTDKELATFVKMGRPPWDPENTTGIDMPSKGGNPALNDEQLDLIIQFIRSVSQSDAG